MHKINYIQTNIQHICNIGPWYSEKTKERRTTGRNPQGICYWGYLILGVISKPFLWHDFLKNWELEELLGINDTWYRKRSDSITDFNEANKTGYILLQHVQSMDNKPNTPSNYGYLDTIFVKDGYIRQTYTDLQSRFFVRSSNNGIWTNWEQMQTT